jgi:radical SAM protein with 4Fe4S-binding SPASM domain
MSLMEQLNRKALRLGVPLSVHLDITYRCNERCEHCYLEHDDLGEMTTPEIRGLLKQLEQSGVFFLAISGGEPLVRRDCFEILEVARSLGFNLKLKTNAILIKEREARELRSLGVEQVQISVYSDRPEVHDAITKVPGSLLRTVAAIRFLRGQGLRVTVANVLMKTNFQDSAGVRALAAELDAQFTLDPTITPMLNGDRSPLRLRIAANEVKDIFRDPSLVGDIDAFCAPPPPVDDEMHEGFPCSAGHTACYISPYGDVYPCVQFPLSCGNVRKETFQNIWRNSSQLREVRSIRGKDLPTCSSCAHLGTCTRCPGLAFMEGNMRGPSSADCEKSFLRTGILTAGMLTGGVVPGSADAHGLVQIELHP